MAGLDPAIHAARHATNRQTCLHITMAAGPTAHFRMNVSREPPFLPSPPRERAMERGLATRKPPAPHARVFDMPPKNGGKVVRYRSDTSTDVIRPLNANGARSK